MNSHSKKCNSVAFISKFSLYIFIILGLNIPSINAQQTLCQQIGANFVPDIVIGINESSQTQTSSLGITGWSSKKIHINGKLIIDNEFQIYICDLRMGKNAEITVSVGGVLKSYFSRYFRCGSDFWNGITVFGDCTFAFNQVEDAYIALDIKSQAANIIFAANTINRNYYGISAVNIAYANILTVANTFDCTSNLNVSHLTPSRAGIRLNNCLGSAIGRLDYPGYRNVFKNQSYGIEIDNSISTIGLSSFYYNSRGINARHSDVLAQGANFDMKNIFRNNTGDIYAQYSSLRVYFSSMDSTNSFNIRSVDNNNSEQVHVRDNEFTLTRYNGGFAADKTAVFVDRPMFGQGNDFRSTIQRNKFTVQDYGSSSRSCIDVKGYQSTNDKMLIDSNFIEAFKGGGENNPSPFIQISVNSANNFIVSRNTIKSSNTFSTGRSRWGIFLNNGSNYPAIGNTLVSNDISGVSVSDVGCCAFHGQNAGPWTICANTTNLTYRGFHFMGNCGKSIFATNTIKDHTQAPSTGNYESAGLIIDYFSNPQGLTRYLGDQDCHSNIWTVTNYPAANANAARITGVLSPSVINMNEFLVEDLSDPHQAPPDRIPLTDWFKLGQCIQAPNCSSGQMPPDLDKFDEWVMSNYPLPNSSPDVEEWDNTRYLMAKIMRFQYLDSGNGSSFKASYNQSSAGRFARFDSMMNNISSAVVNSQGLLDHTTGHF